VGLEERPGHTNWDMGNQLSGCGMVSGFWYGFLGLDVDLVGYVYLHLGGYPYSREDLC